MACQALPTPARRLAKFPPLRPMGTLTANCNSNRKTLTRPRRKSRSRSRAANRWSTGWAGASPTRLRSRFRSHEEFAMRPRINLSLQVAAGILALIAPCFLAAQGAPAVSLEEQLSAQYTLVKMGSDSSGPAVVEPGTILAIQKGGILGVPYGNMNMLPAKYQDGTLHPPATATSNSATSMGSKVCGFFGKCNSTKEQVGKQTTTRLFQ